MNVLHVANTHKNKDISFHLFRMEEAENGNANRAPTSVTGLGSAVAVTRIAQTFGARRKRIRDNNHYQGHFHSQHSNSTARVCLNRIKDK